MICEEYARHNNNFQNEILLMLEIHVPFERRIWMKERSDATWQILRDADNDRWKEAFRINKSSFDFLCSRLETALKPKENAISTREHISADKQIAITLYKLASCCEYRVVGDAFGAHKSTVHKIVYRVLNCIVNELSGEMIKFPKNEEAKTISNAFQEKCGLPMIIGCIDGCHIPILAPKDGYSDFLNRKGWTSIIMQGVVDHKYRYKL